MAVRMVGSGAPSVDFEPNLSTLWDGPLSAGATSTQAITANRLYMIPYIVGRGVARTKLGINVTTGSAGGARLGIYAETAGGLPGALLLDAGTVDTTSIAQVDATVTAFTLAPGRYYLALVSNATPTLTVITASSFWPRLGYDTSLGIIGHIYRAFTYAALPADESAQTYTPGTLNVPLVILKQ